MITRVEIFDPKKGKPVLAGIIDGNTFFRKVKRKKHFLFKFNSYAIQQSAIDEILEAGVLKIVFIENKYRRLYCSVGLFQNVSRDIDFGHGLQRMIDERYLTVEDDRQETFQ